MGNLGKVCMSLCIYCKKAYGILLQRREWPDIFKWNQQIPHGSCDECEKNIAKAMKSGIRLICQSCIDKGIIGQLLIVKTAALRKMLKNPKLKSGETYRIHSCNNCNADGSIGF